ncbi:MAG: NAD(P)/FAD-dependent oxidoreductase, partial [bacterium]|nr:NAD(P)/FAD-dependent oxidoreductase [bacterium]
MAINEIKTKTVVGIIGAGISGLTTAYQLKKHGIDFRIIEADDDVGGVWRQKSYEECFLITSRKSTFLSGSAQPEDYPDFPSAKQFLQYIRDYVDKNGLREHIRFNSRVESARPDGQEWIVETKDGFTHRFSHLVVCSGVNHVPHMPEYPGTFTGEVIHSVDYKSFDRLRDKRVLV